MIYAPLLGMLAVTSLSLPADEQTVAVVRFADLDLGSANGRAELERRIESAARRVCDEPRLPSTWQQARIASCIAGARTRALQQLDQVLVWRNRAAEIARNQFRDAEHL